MTTMSATEARKQLYQLLDAVARSHEPVQITGKRGNAVLDHLKATFQDPDLDKEVGLLMLGEEFAQLDKDYCTWQRSGDPAVCSNAELNRSAFVAWIDCRL